MPLILTSIRILYLASMQAPFGSFRVGKVILQPEIFYSQQGGSSRIEFRDNNNVPMGSADVKSKVNYINIPVLVNLTYRRDLLFLADRKWVSLLPLKSKPLWRTGPLMLICYDLPNLFIE